MTNQPTPVNTRRIHPWSERFASQSDLLWANLSRFTGLLAMLNITLFFVTQAVTKSGYFYTFYSLGLLAAVEAALLLPHGLFKRLWFYNACLVLESGALYFFVSSVRYWVNTNRV